ncbi:hypothetical protein L9F63_022147, partial [Diploptera punctata]
SSCKRSRTQSRDLLKLRFIAKIAPGELKQINYKNHNTTRFTASPLPPDPIGRMDKDSVSPAARDAVINGDVSNDEHSIGSDVAADLAQDGDSMDSEREALNLV